MTDETRQSLVWDLVRDEGTGPIIKDRLMPYVDTTGHTTIGFGRNIQDRGISMDEAELLLTNDIKETLATMAMAFPWSTSMDPVRQRVLANMLFNLGLTKLSGFVATLRAMKAGDYDLAAVHMTNTLWYRQTKRRAERLVAMMRTGTA